MIYFTFFLMVTLTIYGLIIMKSEKKQRVEKRISILKIDNSGENDSINKQEQQKSLFQRMVFPIWKEFKKSFKRKMPGEKQAKLELRLLQAGSPFGMTPVDYRMLQFALILLLPFLSAGYAHLLQMNGSVVILFGLVGLAGAFVLPTFYLKQKVKVRNVSALKELPDILDLLTVSLEAGLGFDSAISKVVSKKEGVLSAEFHRCLEEIRLGKTRREALAGIRDRLIVDEIRTLISSILQAEKLGIGMVQVLRVQSNEVRDQRKQRAEEEAMKAPIKMLFPLVLFIFPSLFIVLLGPAIIQFLQTFK
ncbi:type II secretion system F family protein [Bacillus timonensis]|nr:type II secretion system F family protein [Bacillus timonensis]